MVNDKEPITLMVKTFSGSFQFQGEDLAIPCWSLAALLNIIPTIIGSVVEKDALILRIDKSETDFNIWYENLDSEIVEEGLDVIKGNAVDACYEIIVRLNLKCCDYEK